MRLASEFPNACFHNLPILYMVVNKLTNFEQDQRRLKMNKKLQQLKAPKKKQLQATKLSVEGRGMVKYL